MRIGIFTNAYHPVVSGVVNAIDCIDRGLTARGHQVCVIAPNYPGYKDEKYSVIRFPSIRVTSRADFPLPFPYQPKLVKQLESLGFNVIHAQHPFLLGALGQRIAKKTKVPMVFTFHTLYEQFVHYSPPIFPRPVLRLIVRKMVSSFVKKSDAVVVPSPSILDLVRRYGGGPQAHLIPNAIDLDAFRGSNGDSVRRKHGLKGKKVMIFVGRLAKEKNLLFLIRGCAKMFARVPNAALMLVGDGPYRQVLENEITKLRLWDDVILPGMIPYSEIAPYYKAADLFVTCSTTEVKPLSLLEAMACGLPILAVKASGAVDTVTDEVDGYLVHENEDEFAAAAVALLTNEKKLASLSGNAKKTAESFGIPVLAQKLEALYLSLSKKGTKKGTGTINDR